MMFIFNNNMTVDIISSSLGIIGLQYLPTSIVNLCALILNWVKKERIFLEMKKLKYGWISSLLWKEMSNKSNYHKKALTVQRVDRLFFEANINPSVFVIPILLE